MASPQIIVLGSVNADLVLRSSKLPAPGETVVGGEFYQAGGGKGANQAVAAARTSGATVGDEPSVASRRQANPVGFIAAVGNDEFGKTAIRQFRKEGISTQHVRMIDGEATGVALIMVDENGENLISVASGANASLTPEHVEAIDDAFFADAKVFLACLESPLETVVAGLRRAKAAGLTTILNPAPACDDVRDREILKLIDILTPNESEAAVLSGWDEFEDLEDLCIACEQLQQKGCRQVVITRGSRGCIAREDSGDPSLIPAFAVDAVDATAAGDCFNGALAAALSEGQRLRQAAQFATAAASISVTTRGAVPSLPSRDAVEELLASDTERSSALG